MSLEGKVDLDEFIRDRGCHDSNYDPKINITVGWCIFYDGGLCPKTCSYAYKIEKGETPLGSGLL